MRSGSTRPARAALAVMTAPDQLGGRRRQQQPARLAPRRWPERPTRCTQRDTPPGSPIWTARSAVPISTPSSRLVLVTTARTCPDRSADSIARRRPASSAEWCATTAQSDSAESESDAEMARSRRRSWVIFSAKARVLAKTTVVRF